MLTGLSLLAGQVLTENLPVAGYQVVKVYPHDPNAFTQGLQFVDGVLYEGTGLNGRSSIRKVKLETGEVLQKRDVPAQHFGEGITVWKTDLIELTWQSQVALVYDRETFQQRRTFNYSGEGWGLTHDGVNLIMSDGTDYLRFLDPATFEVRRRARVMVGDTRCAPIEVLAPPPRCTPPIITVTIWSPTGTVPVTGEGGRPPPTKIWERVPPQIFSVSDAPEAFSRLSA